MAIDPVSSTAGGGTDPAIDEALLAEQFGEIFAVTVFGDIVRDAISENDEE